MIQAIIWSVIAVLIVTGGYRGKIELAQLDALGFLALALGLMSWKRTGHFLEPRVENAFTRLTQPLRKYPREFLIALFVFHVALFTVIQIFGYQSFHINAFDIGFIDQGVWTTAYLREQTAFLHSDLARGVGSYLSEHFSPILVIFVPLYRISASIYWLFFAQAALLGSGALLLYKIARHHRISTSVSLVFAALFLSYQPFKGASLFNFREDDLFVPVFLGMILAMEKRKWFWFWALAVISLLTKESAPLITLALGVWATLRGHRAHGIALSVASLVSFYVINSLVMPMYSGGAQNTVFTSRLAFLGSSFSEIAQNTLLHPIDSLVKMVKARFTGQTFRYLLIILLPFLPFLTFRPLRTGFAYVIALALLAMNLIITEHKIGFHYEAILIPFLFVGLIHGYIKRAHRFGQTNAVALLVTLFICVYGRSPMLTLREWYPNADHRCLAQTIKQLPTDASILTQSSLFPHLDHRSETIIFGDADKAREDFVVLTPLDSISAYPHPNFTAEMGKMAQTRYVPVVLNNVARIWCAPESCAKYANAVQAVKAVTCVSGESAR